MNQFTSHINFKLTKKRLVLLNKKRSLMRRITRLLPVLPIFLFIIFVFCTEQHHPDEVYFDIRLQQIPPPYEQVQDSGVYYNSRMYDMNGELFTGIANSFFKSDDKLLTSVTYKEGLRVKEQIFKRTGEELYRVETDYDFVSGEQISFHVFEEGVLTMQSLTQSPDHNGLDVYREWFSNGQLKFEMTSYSEDKRPIIYEGMMIRYNQQGDIIEQELYKDGNLVEKIK